MKNIFALALFLACLYYSHAQTSTDLVRDVQANTGSVTALRNVIKKHALFKDTLNRWSASTDTTGFLQHKKLFEGFRFQTQAGTDTYHNLVCLHATYKGEQLAYVRIDDGGRCDADKNDHIKTIFFQYFDSSYTAGILSAYNSTQHTDFTWSDLYDDELDRFRVDGGLTMPEPGDINSTGNISADLGLSGEMRILIPFIINKDHQAIVKYCKSFNPVRQTYGATGLYTMQALGEPLSIEEKQLLKRIRQSPERIHASIGCLGYPDKRIRDILTQQELDYIVIQVKRVMKGSSL